MGLCEVKTCPALDYFLCIKLLQFQGCGKETEDDQQEFEFLLFFGALFLVPKIRQKCLYKLVEAIIGIRAFRAEVRVEYSQSHVRATGTIPSAPRRDFLPTDHKVAQIPQPYGYGFSPVVRYDYFSELPRNPTHNNLPFAILRGKPWVTDLCPEVSFLAGGTAGPGPRDLWLLDTERVEVAPGTILYRVCDLLACGRRSYMSLPFWQRLWLRDVLLKAHSCGDARPRREDWPCLATKAFVPLRDLQRDLLPRLERPDDARGWGFVEPGGGDRVPVDGLVFARGDAPYRGGGQRALRKWKFEQPTLDLEVLRSARTERGYWVCWGLRCPALRPWRPALHSEVAFDWALIGQGARRAVEDYWGAWLLRGPPPAHPGLEATFYAPHHELCLVNRQARALPGAMPGDQHTEDSRAWPVDWVREPGRAAGQGQPSVCSLPQAIEELLRYKEAGAGANLTPRNLCFRVCGTDVQEAGFVVGLAYALPWQDHAVGLEGGGPLPPRRRGHADLCRAGLGRLLHARGAAAAQARAGLGVGGSADGRPCRLAPPPSATRGPRRRPTSTPPCCSPCARLAPTLFDHAVRSKQTTVYVCAGATEPSPHAPGGIAQLCTDCLGSGARGTTLRWWSPFIAILLLGPLSVAALVVDIVHMFEESGQTTKVYQTVSAMNGVVMCLMAVLVLASIVSLSSERGVAQGAAGLYQKPEAPGGTSNWKSMRAAVARVQTKVSVLAATRDRVARLRFMSTSFLFAALLQIIAFAFIIRVQYESPDLLGVDQEQKWNVSLRDGNGTAICSQCVLQAVDTAAACETMRLLSWIWGIGFSIVANALVDRVWYTECTCVYSRDY
eukprot:g36206.t1